MGKHFEVREHDAPVNYVFNGSTRVARVTGSLSANERIQRLRLRAGWNLVSLAVTAPDFLSQLQEFTSGPTPVIRALYRWQPATQDHGTIPSGESVAAGTVLWISARTNGFVAVRGTYVEPSQWSAPGGDTFVAVPALEAQPLTVPAGVTIWRYDGPSRHWQAELPGDLASFNDLPPSLAPGEAIHVHSNDPADLGARGGKGLLEDLVYHGRRTEGSRRHAPQVRQRGTRQSRPPVRGRGPSGARRAAGVFIRPGPSVFRISDPPVVLYSPTLRHL